MIINSPTVVPLDWQYLSLISFGLYFSVAQNWIFWWYTEKELFFAKLPRVCRDYQGVRNVSFSENLVYVLKEGTFRHIQFLSISHAIYFLVFCLWSLEYTYQWAWRKLWIHKRFECVSSSDEIIFVIPVRIINLVLPF